jgi:hypothetical protein
MTSAREFTARLLELLRREQGAMADFLVALADFDRKRLWVELGYSSLFHFLHRELGMSKGAAHYRKTAAELIQRVPEVVEPLRAGQLCITSIIELAKVVTPENRLDVLPRFFHCSRQEAKAVSAELSPAEAAPHRTVVTTMALPVTSAPRAVAAEPTRSVELPLSEAEAARAAPARMDPAHGPVAGVQPVEPREIEAPVSRPVATERATPRALAEPLTADLRRLHVTVSRRFLEKLEVARDALSHSHPGADAEAILEAGLDLLIERHAKRKGIVAKPRKASAPLARIAGRGEGGCEPVTPPSTEGSRHIPAHVQREVWIRDGGRCQWPIDGGGICGSTHRIQFDHIVPRARGGVSTVVNLRLACQVHNLLAARQMFGETFIGRFIGARPPEAGSDLR